MKIGPRYKRARRLGADLFEKTQTAKYALRAGRGGALGYGRSDFGQQLMEKQRARTFYGIGERQFSTYVKNARDMRSVQDGEALYRSLERRLDNCVYRLGCAPTRAAARQMVSHGHFSVNGTRITTPSYPVAVGDVLRVRERSRRGVLFQNLADRLRDRESPHWLRFDLVKGEATVVALPRFSKTQLPFSIAAILEFYRR